MLYHSQILNIGFCCALVACVCWAQHVEKNAHQLDVYWFWLAHLSSTVEQIRNSMANTQAELHRLGVTERVLSELSDDVPLYKNYGKAYILEPRADIRNKAAEAHKVYVETLETLAKRDEQLSARAKEAQGNLREFVESHAKSAK